MLKAEITIPIHGMSCQKCVAKVTAALQDEDETVRKAAARSLKRIKDSASVGVAGQSGFTAILSNGVTVELVGVCEHPSEGKQWWRPDGSMLEQEPYGSMPAKVHPSASETAYEFCVSVKNSRDFGYKYKIVQASNNASGTPRPYEAGMNSMVASLAKEKQQTIVKIAIAIRVAQCEIKEPSCGHIYRSSDLFNNGFF